MSIIYVGCVGVIVLAVLGILGFAQDITHEMRGRGGRQAEMDEENPHQLPSEV